MLYTLPLISKRVYQLMTNAYITPPFPLPHGFFPRLLTLIRIVSDAIDPGNKLLWVLLHSWEALSKYPNHTHLWKTSRKNSIYGVLHPKFPAFSGLHTDPFHFISCGVCILLFGSPLQAGNGLSKCVSSHKVV